MAPGPACPMCVRARRFFKRARACFFVFVFSNLHHLIATHPPSAHLPPSSCADVTVPAHGRAIVPTGLALAAPAGTYARVAPRSGLAVKHFIDTGAGVVDEDYRGEVGVVLFNHGDAAFEGACARGGGGGWERGRGERQEESAGTTVSSNHSPTSIPPHLSPNYHLSCPQSSAGTGSPS